MPHANRLHDDTNLIGRSTSAFMMSSVVALFVALAVAVAIYDIGDLLGIW